MGSFIFQNGDKLSSTRSETDILEFMPNTIHVRNHNYHKDYEILQVNQSFCDLHPDEEDE